MSGLYKIITGITISDLEQNINNYKCQFGFDYVGGVYSYFRHYSNSGIHEEKFFFCQAIAERAQ